MWSKFVSSRLPSTMKSDRLLWLALLIPVFLSGLSAQGATAVNQPPPVVRTNFSIVENRTENEMVGQLVEYGGANFRFGAESAVCSRFFSIDNSTSIIRTVGMLDREAVYREEGTDQLQCFVQYENTSAGLDENDRITIHILDINDEIPHFRNLLQPHIVEVPENVAAPSFLLRLEPIDDDKGDNGTVHEFNITSGDTNYFTVMKAEGDNSDTTTRQLFLQSMLDFEVNRRRFDLTIRLSDKGDPSNFYDQQIVIFVNNSLDEPPTFATSRFFFVVNESHPVGIAHPFANAMAANPNQVLGSITYSLCEESGCARSGPDGVILVNQANGDLYLNQSLEYDFGGTSTYTFYVKATNRFIGASQNAYVEVTVEDANDNAPYFTCVSGIYDLPCPPESSNSPHFTRMNFSTGENNFTDKRRLRLMGHDDDLHNANNSYIQYSASSEPPINFTFTPFFGSIIVGIDQMLDRESTPDITITITANNSRAIPPLSSTAVISIHVEDLNDNAPVFTQSLYNAYVSEGSPVDKYVAKVEAFDSDVGENATVSYSITSVDKTAAADWFRISTTTGVISVALENINYHAVQGVVVLNVTAMDNGTEPLSSTTLVRVEVVPAITFSSRSYQAFANYDLAAAQNQDPLGFMVYLEFQTSSRSDGVLLYHQGEDGSFSLGLEEGKVVLRHGEVPPNKDELSIIDNVWYSVLLLQNSQLEVWRTGSRNADSALTEAIIQNCPENEVVNRPSEELLYVGGINPLSLTDVNASRADFVGAIRNVVIGQSQVNLRCPQEENNTLTGVQRSDLCEKELLTCHPVHSMGCVDYAEESFCRCEGGFASQICSSPTHSAEDSYAPIRLHGNGHVTLNLPYSFFYDLKVMKQSGGNDGGGPSIPGGKRRKRRQENVQEILQKVELTFRPVEVGASVLLHSETERYVHQLMISNQDAIVYQVFDIMESRSEFRDQILIPDIDFQNETEYQVTITYNNVETRMGINVIGMRPALNNDPWDSDPITLFAEEPETTLSIGGAPRGGDNFFIGCITSLKIDEIEIPLSGLARLPAEEGGFMHNALSGLVVEPYCNLCDLVNCPSNKTCASDNYGGTDCLRICPEGYVLDQQVDSCFLVQNPTAGSLAPGTPSDQSSIYYIAGGTVGGVLLVGVTIIILIAIVRTQHVRHDKRKRTYSVTSISNGILPPQRTSKSGNDYVRVEPRINVNDGDDFSALGTTCRSDSRDRGSSISTFQEHADDADPEIDEPRRLQRRKSTVSAESGIRTDTERDSSIRGTSRMDDSGTDYTPQESESDDMTSSCFMEPVDSASSVMGVPVKVASPCIPLTPQERKVVTPLRPDGIRLSTSEDDRRDTDIDTDFSSCNLQSLHQNRPLQRESDSDTPSTPKWYKSSTASDNEREKERVHKNAAYYPTRSEPMQYPPRPKTAFSGPAPDYVPPPSISTRKSASPGYSHSPTRRYPPTMISTDSPLARNTHKYENYPLPYSSSTMPRSSDSMRGQASSTTTTTTSTRGAIAGYDNHRLQHQSSAPPPQESHHSGGQGVRHVYFAKSSQTLHYSHSAGNGPYASSSKQQQTSSHPNPSRQYYNTLSSTIPTSLQYRPNRSYSSSDAPPSDREPTQFQDLKNVSTINPITYWETQDRLKPAVDQVDPYQVLSEPYIQFEDVSTDLSVTDSQGTLQADNGADHEVFESQGGGEGTADMGPGCLTRFQDHDIDSIITTDTQSIQGSITHFPSADCSNEYTATIHGTSSSGDSTPKFQPSNGMVFPSQQSFDV